MTEETDCSICCETYNKSSRKIVICQFTDCNYSCCKTCVRTYLLGTIADPHCMNCKKPWEQKFIVENLNRTFCEKEYKSHRKNLLIDREISKLPETMILAERQKKINVEMEIAKQLKEKYLKLQKEVNSLKLKYNICFNNAYLIENNFDKNNTPENRKKFIMSCPNNDCRGYLSTQYKCQLCELFTCPDCLEIIGYNKTDEHVCNPDNISSAELIKKETKACPSCGIRIFKVSGCSQMWCTECKVAFDYNTGKIDSGVVHNPHYYEHMRLQNNGEAIRNPNDVICGGLCSFQTLQHNVINTIKKCINTHEYVTLSGNIYNIHQIVSHITYHDLPRIRNLVRNNEDHQDLRIDYILGIKDKKQMGTQIYKKDNIRKKNVDLLHLYELLNVVCIENFAYIVNYKHDIKYINISSNLDTHPYIIMINDKIQIIKNLFIYCNKEFAKISVTYNCKVLFITDKFRADNIKYKLSDITSIDKVD
jgi:hypothetical protein